MPKLPPEYAEEFYRRRAVRSVWVYRWLATFSLVLINVFTLVELISGEPNWRRAALLRLLATSLGFVHIQLLSKDAGELQVDRHVCRHLLMMTLFACHVIRGLSLSFVIGLPVLVQILYVGSFMMVRSSRVPWLLSLVGLIAAFLAADGPPPNVFLLQITPLCLGLLMAWHSARLHEVSARREFLLETQLQVEASTDSMTGLLNRRSLQTMVVEESARAQRYQRSLSFLLLDIDHFKKINDTHGHDVGDIAIRAAAAVCRQAVRSSDRVARWGGEEILIVLPETSAQQARVLAERLRSDVERLEMDAPFRMTVSIGVAELSAPWQWEEAVKQADQALYQAKEAGRNRVVVIEP